MDLFFLLSFAICWEGYLLGSIDSNSLECTGFDWFELRVNCPAFRSSFSRGYSWSELTGDLCWFEFDLEDDISFLKMLIIWESSASCSTFCYAGFLTFFLTAVSIFYVESNPDCYFTFFRFTVVLRLCILRFLDRENFCNSNSVSLTLICFSCSIVSCIDLFACACCFYFSMYFLILLWFNFSVGLTVDCTI